MNNIQISAGTPEAWHNGAERALAPMNETLL